MLLLQTDATHIEIGACFISEFRIIKESEIFGKKMQKFMKNLKKMYLKFRRKNYLNFRKKLLEF